MSSKDKPKHTCTKDGIKDQEWPLHQKDQPSLMPPSRSPSVSILGRKNFDLAGSRVFVLEKFLSPQDCKYYIEQAKKIGYSSLTPEFQADYRNNKRLSVNCPELAAHLWEVMKPQFLAEDLEGVTPFGFGNQGEWRPVGLGAWFKFSEYEPGTYFKAHMDSSYVLTASCQSIYTLMLYLNGDFEGGQTAFYARDDVDGTKKPAFLLPPVAGRAVVFNHDTRHAGLEVTKGTKYIMRTEVLFEKVSELPPTVFDKQSYKTAKKLFDDADKLEQQGRYADACGLHLQAMELQATRGTFDFKEGREGCQANMKKWPITKDTNAHLFSFLSLRDVGKLARVAKRLFVLSRDGAVWKKLYQEKWPSAYLYENNNTANSAAALQGWYPRFRSAWLANHKFCPFIFDFGVCSTKYGMVGNHAKERTLAVAEKHCAVSVIGLEYRHHYSISGSGEDDILRIGEEILDTYCTDIRWPVPLITDNNVRPSLRFVKRVFLGHGIQADLHPVLVARPMLLVPGSNEANTWDKNAGGLFFHQELKVPSLAIVDSAVAVLQGRGLRRGLCVSVGYSHVVFAVVREGERVFTLSVPFRLEHSFPLNQKFAITLAALNSTHINAPPRMNAEATVENSSGPTIESLYFKPSKILGDQGLPGFVYEGLDKSKSWDLLDVFVLTGGVAELEGFAARFTKDLLALLSAEQRDKFRMVPNKMGRGVIEGAAVMAQTGDFKRLFHPPPEDLLGAVYRGAYHDVKRMLESKADPEQREKAYKQTALAIASSRGHLDIVKLLIGHGANVFAKDKDEWSALDIAKSKGHTLIVRVLERNGAT